jgi:hypothetical protein
VAVTIVLSYFLDIYPNLPTKPPNLSPRFIHTALCKCGLPGHSIRSDYIPSHPHIIPGGDLLETRPSTFRIKQKCTSARRITTSNVKAWNKTRRCGSGSTREACQACPTLRPKVVGAYS